MVRKGDVDSIIASGRTTGVPFVGEHYIDGLGQTNYVSVAWDAVLRDGDALKVNTLDDSAPGIALNAHHTSGVTVDAQSAVGLELQWSAHLAAIGHSPLFHVGAKYTRPDICRLLGVAPDRQGGDWNTGSHQHNNDWFIFASVGTSGRTGHDYDNYWSGDELVWRGRNGSRIDQPKTQSQLNPPGKVFIFTRDNDRSPFTYEGTAKARDARNGDNGGPVIIRWYFLDRRDQRPEVLPDELLEGEKFREGAARTIKVNAYERNPAARRKCVEHYGAVCAVCQFNFQAVYGELGEGYIHVHHLRDLASIGEEYEVDPIADLRPVCPNCHAMLHRRYPAMAIEALKTIMERIE
jgi:5-methylcytosine-specific restriction protein A